MPKAGRPALFPSSGGGVIHSVLCPSVESGVCVCLRALVKGIIFDSLTLLVSPS